MNPNTINVLRCLVGRPGATYDELVVHTGIKRASVAACVNALNGMGLVRWHRRPFGGREPRKWDVTDQGFHRAVDLWHDADTTDPVHVWLGLSLAAYAERAGFQHDGSAAPPTSADPSSAFAQQVKPARGSR